MNFVAPLRRIVRRLRPQGKEMFTPPCASCCPVRISISSGSGSTKVEVVQPSAPSPEEIRKAFLRGFRKGLSRPAGAQSED